MTFADAALRAWSLAAGLLGWRPAEFWAATPAELATGLRPGAPDALGTDDLESLKERFPDG